MAKFVVYEKVAEFAWSKIDKSTSSDGVQTAVNLGSGLIAGFAAAAISQPADTMLSKINKTQGLPGEGTTSRLIKIAKELGIRKSFTGIGARLFMVGTITVSYPKFLSFFAQWLNFCLLGRSIRYLWRLEEGVGSHRRCRNRKIDVLILDRRWDPGLCNRPRIWAD